MRYWRTYQKIVNTNCTKPTYERRDLDYLQDHLFAGMICYLLPLSLIALVPGLYMSYVMGKIGLGLADILVFAGMAFVAFVPAIALKNRKIIFVSCLYLLSCSLFYFLGFTGPALVYLLATSVFGILIFPASVRFLTAWVNAIICFVFLTGATSFQVPGFSHTGFTLGAGFAVASNLVFLSFLSAALIPQLFNGLQETIDVEMKVKKILHDQQISLNQALEMLQQKNIELEQFAYVASHDLKEPVRMVVSFMGLLQSRYEGELDEKAQNYIKIAMDGGRRMQGMIDDLLEYSRTAHHDAVKEPVYLNLLLKEVELNISQLIAENNVQIVTGKDLPVLQVYRSDMIRLLQNLLINAIKFSKKDMNPVIRIGAQEIENSWLVSIEDNGIGIEKDKFEKVFEIFGRLHARESYEGTGIGLAICKKVVEQHGGRIWVESEEGIGSTFFFEILK